MEPLLIVIWFSAFGVLLVASLLIAAAVGKWKRGVGFRMMAWFSIVGAVIPIVLYPVWTHVNHHFGLEAQLTVEHVVEVLWPSAIGLMALEAGGSIISAVFLVTVLVLLNAGLYGAVGLLSGLAWQRFIVKTNA